MISETLYKSTKEDWGTPSWLFERLNTVYDFQLDAAASTRNALCSAYFTKDENALEQDWAHYRRVWLNPPYGRNISLWMAKAYEESLKGALVVCLVHARTDTRWWHDHVEGKARISFIKGRLRFIDGETQESGDAAPFPSVLVIYDPLDRHMCGPGACKCSG